MSFYQFLEERFSSAIWKVIFKQLTLETQMFITHEVELACDEAIAEREREIVEMVKNLIKSPDKTDCHHETSRFCDCDQLSAGYNSALSDIIQKLKE